jgi:hypothetical protein
MHLEPPDRKMVRRHMVDWLLAAPAGKRSLTGHSNGFAWRFQMSMTLMSGTL